MRDQIPYKQHCNKIFWGEKLQILSHYNLSKDKGATPFTIAITTFDG